MDLNERIERRKRQADVSELIRDYESLSPVAHIEEPPARGQVFEQLLDHLDHAFDGRLPPNAYVHGPPGSGKSASVVALFEHLEAHATGSEAIIHTSTRVDSTNYPQFVYLDLRESRSEFAFYHTILDALIEDAVPKHGISTEKLQSRLRALLDESSPGVVVAIDHVGESNTVETGELIDRLAGLPSAVSWLAIGRADPETVALTEYTGETIEIEPYQRQLLVDVLMTRAAMGLSQKALDHELAQTIADWADGNAHDGLSALFVAAESASDAGRAFLEERDVPPALEELPDSPVSLGQVLVLPENRQSVLRAVVEADPTGQQSIQSLAEELSTRQSVDLSSATVKRFLYELAEDGLLERVPIDDPASQGRPPSQLELQFSGTVFRRLYDLNN